MQKLLDHADIQIGGDRPWDIDVHNEQTYERVLAGGQLALGESYMDGWWDCEALDQCIHRLLQADLDNEVQTWKMAWLAIKAKVLNRQNQRRAYEVGEEHYDRGNDLFEKMLDAYMVYSCGYWKNADSLAEAQKAKLDLICQKLGLEAGNRVLDIGCGWGGFAQYAAEEYGAQVVGITISKEQAELARSRCQDFPIEIRLQDYRDLQGETFDHIVSIGMFEHVGAKNYETYFDVVRRSLKEGGLMLLETIGARHTSLTTDAWTNKYIFPNGSSPSAKQITEALEERLVIEDWHNFGIGYDKTLMKWHDNFTSHWDSLKSDYDERFFRMWTYYLLSCAGSFRARRSQNWQLVLSPEGVPDGYESVR